VGGAPYRSKTRLAGRREECNKYFKIIFVPISRLFLFLIFMWRVARVLLCSKCYAICEVFVEWHRDCYAKKMCEKVKKCLALLPDRAHSVCLMQSLTHTQLFDIIKNSKGTAIIGIEALTEPKVRKTGNPFSAILKHVRAVAFVGAGYGKAVRNEGERQGATEAATFQAAPLPWGTWEVENKIITHKGARYLRTQSTPGQRKRQAAKVLSYRDAEGRFLSPEAVKPFLPEKSDSARQSAVGLAEKIQVNTYKFSSIRKVRIAGQSFAVVAD